MQNNFFNKDFYPTPENVIQQMVSGMDIIGKTIFEPSAGSGNIVDFLQKNGVHEVIACEINPDLRKILESKCHVISNDFLAVTKTQISHIDCIIMNPPFSADEKHILHAWDICPDGCEIVALCNWETINNDYSHNRKLLRAIVKDNGNMLYLGDVFSNAARKTNINIGLIRLFKEKTGEDEFQGYFDLDEEFENNQDNGLMSYNSIRDIVNRYVGAVKMFDEVLATANRINSLAQPFANSCDISFGAFWKGRNNYSQITRDIYKKELQKAAWQEVFKKMKMKKYVTSSVMEDINKFVEKQTVVPFTMRNVYKMIEMIVGTHSSRMERVIVEVFDKLTKHYHENRFQLEGWKTNSEYQVNRKFIIDWGMIQTTWGGKMEASYRNSENYVIDDLTKALCYIMGEDYNKMQDWWNFTHNYKKVEKYGRFENEAQYLEFGQWYDFNFFQIKGFKKGTVHVKFKDEDIWNRFNQIACKAKGFQLASKFTSDFRKRKAGVDLFSKKYEESYS